MVSLSGPQSIAAVPIPSTALPSTTVVERRYTDSRLLPARVTLTLFSNRHARQPLP